MSSSIMSYYSALYNIIDIIDIVDILHVYIHTVHNFNSSQTKPSQSVIFLHHKAALLSATVTHEFALFKGGHLNLPMPSVGVPITKGQDVRQMK